MAAHLIHIKDHLNLDRPKADVKDLVSLFKLV
jgi:hypothetical protein